MATQLEPYIENFVQEGIKRGHTDIRYEIMSKINFVLLTDGLPSNTFGVVDSISRTAYISTKTLTDTLIVRSTVYHEISHLLKNSEEHTCYNCSDIMSETSPETFAIYFDNTFWQKELDKLFKWLYKK